VAQLGQAADVILVETGKGRQAVGRQVEARWSGRICTWPVLTTDTRPIGSFWFISVFLR
jgi:hypothetical protein